MDKHFKHGYKNKSNRANWWDYSNPAAYFITICTKNREKFFGEIINTEMVLNDVGKLADKFWEDIPKHIKGVELGEFVVMPNHIHGILILTNQKPVGALHATPLLVVNNKMSEISPKKGSLSVIIRSYKSVVTRESRTINPDFGWQANYYDRIIRNYEEYLRIEEYIHFNPENWNKDKFTS